MAVDPQREHLEEDVLEILERPVHRRVMRRCVQRWIVREGRNASARAMQVLPRAQVKCRVRRQTQPIARDFRQRIREARERALLLSWRRRRRLVLPRFSLAEQDFLEQVEREVEVLVERWKEAAVTRQAVVRWHIEIPW